MSIIVDNHMHLQRNGLYIEAVKQFEQAGGTHIVLVQHPNPGLAAEKKSYLPLFEETLKMADEVREKTSVGVFVVVGPYPVDLLIFTQEFGLSLAQAVNLMKMGMVEAAALCANRSVIGIGEIGRPHFEVSKEIWDASNEVLSFGMKAAKEIDVPVILHTEHTTSETCKEFVDMAKRVGLSKKRVIKHFSPPLVLEKENFGLMPSIIAREKNIKKALEKGSFRFLMETDYIDDLSHPGMVCGPKTVPKTTKKLIEKGVLSFEDSQKIHVDCFEKTYDVCLDDEGSK